MDEDKRLDRLFDYTKWHIGIYLSIGAGLVALLGSRDGNSFLQRLIGCPFVMGVGLGAMLIAGISGGIVASATTRCRSFDELWGEPLEVYGRTTFTGKEWACIEHTAFWACLALLAASVLGPKVLAQLGFT